MFIVLLRFSQNKKNAPAFMDAHKAWINQGIEEGVFRLVGSLQPNQGGCLLVTESSRDALERRIAADPFVAENIVTAEILEVEPNYVDSALSALT